MQRLFGVLLVLCLQVLAEPATCDPSYYWYFWASNSQNQDPCVVATKLLLTCPSFPTIQLLTNSTFYPGPTAATQNSCTCSYVIYNLLSACGDCQVGNQAPTAWPAYLSWASSCSSSNQVMNFPNTVPSDTTIPTWATVNFTVSGDTRWSYGLSYAIARGNVDLTGKSEPLPTTVPATGSQSTRTLNIPAAGSAPPTASPGGANQPTDLSDSTACSSKVSAGPVAGGTLGGVVFGILIAVLCMSLFRRRTRIIAGVRPGQPNKVTSMNSLPGSPPPTTVEPYLFQQQHAGGHPIPQAPQLTSTNQSFINHPSYHTSPPPNQFMHPGASGQFLPGNYAGFHSSDAIATTNYTLQNPVTEQVVSPTPRRLKSPQLPAYDGGDTQRSHEPSVSS